jgi:hypothetical protein
VAWTFDLKGEGFAETFTRKVKVEERRRIAATRLETHADTTKRAAPTRSRPLSRCRGDGGFETRIA